jgi:glycosyltransferase involved in cell wall biosynthesis
MQDGDIFILPSDFEGFSIATAEAMSVGLPSIAFQDCEGLSELIINDKTGFLTEKTPQDLAKHIEILIENPDLRLEFSKNAKERIKEFAPEIICDKWENAIKKAVLIHNKKSIRKFFILFYLYINIFFRVF